jgi:hypothetical protein
MKPLPETEHALALRTDFAPSAIPPEVGGPSPTTWNSPTWTSATSPMPQGLRVKITENALMGIQMNDREASSPVEGFQTNANEKE